MSLSELVGIEYNRLLALIVADLLLYRLAVKDKIVRLRPILGRVLVNLKKSWFSLKS